MKTYDFLNTLAYWRNIEFFLPFKLDNVIERNQDAIVVKTDDLLELPWNDYELHGLNSEKEYYYDFYFSIFKLEDVKRLLINLFPEIKKEYIPDTRDLSGYSCFARILLNSDGLPLFQDLNVSSFPWAIKLLTQKKELSLNAFEDFIASSAENLKNSTDFLPSKSNSKKKLDRKSLLNLCNFFSDELQLGFNPNNICGYLIPYSIGNKKEDCSEKNKKKKERKLQKLQDSEKALINIIRKKRKVDILNSFYIRDLERTYQELKSNLQKSTPIYHFLQTDKNIIKKHNLLTKNGIAIASKLLSSKTALMGRWPAKTEQMPSLNQDLACQIYKTKKFPILSVNGPPGTGKTVLLRDLIADIIVARALKLSKLKKPEDAFLKEKNSVEIGKRNFSVRTLINELKGYEVLVASNNNAAVENISNELPKLINLGEDFQDLSYLKQTSNLYQFVAKKNKKDFTDDKIIDEASHYWGLPSIALGNSSNREKFRRAAFAYEFEETKENTKKRLEDLKLLTLFDIRKLALENNKSFYQAKKYFIEKLDEYNQELKKHNIKYNFDKNIEDDEISKIDFQLNAKIYNPELNKYRSNLFQAALLLHETWIKETPGLNAELKAISTLIRNPQSIASTNADNLWSILFLIIPVISTTLASTERMLGPLSPNTIGNVIIDEAGQATPQSCVGILLRAKNALIVGDQKQLEPIVSIPLAIDKYFARNIPNTVYKMFSPLLSSVQSISDSSCPFGTVFNKGSEEETWVGIPLLIHRRCSDPMFSIANEIAYDGVMISAKNKANEQFLNLAYSSWIHTEGSIKNKHWVPEQGLVLESLLKDLFHNSDFSKIPDFFCISPFKDVRNNTKALVKKLIQNKKYSGLALKEINKRIGTIHSFQGKEASIVFLVLGCDYSTEQAANWAGEKPNLINVAITRAKERLYVIGDKNVWHNKGYFSDLQKNLPNIDQDKFLLTKMVKDNVF